MGNDNVKVLQFADDLTILITGSNDEMQIKCDKAMDKIYHQVEELKLKVDPEKCKVKIERMKGQQYLGFLTADGQFKQKIVKSGK